METTLFENPDTVAMVELTDRATERSEMLDAEQPICDQCGNSFEPRKGSGGKRQRFCATECRLAWHVEHPKAQRSPTCSGETPLPLVQVAPEPKIAPAQSTWDWVEDREDVVVPSQPAIAVYWTVRSQLMLRQEGMLGDQEDQFIGVHPANVPALIAKLQTEYDSWKRDYRG